MGLQERGFLLIFEDCRWLKLVHRTVLLEIRKGKSGPKKQNDMFLQLSQTKTEVCVSFL